MSQEDLMSMLLDPGVPMDATDDPRTRDVYARDDRPAAPRPARPESPANIVARWRTEGQLVRVATGIEQLDAACRGGLPVPWRVVIIGAPAAGKTFMLVTIGRHLALGGVRVGVLAVDEEPDDVTVRLAQMAGFRIDDAERREPATLERMRAQLEDLPVRLYDGAHTIEDAAADLAAWAQGRPAVLCIDSLQTVRSVAAGAARSPREAIEGNVAAVRDAAARHRLLTVATSEANRNAYRSQEAVAASNDLAAGAESRAIEYGSQTLLMLRTPQGHGDVIHVHIAKNRRGDVGDLWLRMDRDRHALSRCSSPDDDPETARSREDARVHAARARVEDDARELGRLLRRHPEGLGSRGLRDAARAEFGWGHGRTDAARYALAEGVAGMRLANAGTKQRPSWRVEADGPEPEP